MIPFAVFSQLLGLGTATGVRAGLSLLLIAVASQLGWVWLPAGLSWMESPAGLGALLAIAVLEGYWERDDDVRKIFGHVQYALHAFSAAIASAVAVTSGSEAPTTAQYAVAGAVAVALSLGTHRWRLGLHRLLYEVETQLLGVRQWISRLEEGGVLAVAIAALLAPFLAAGAVVLFVAAGALGALLARRFEARWRRACPACGAAIRVEASRCPKCRADVEVAQWKDLRQFAAVQDAAARAARAVTETLASADRRKAG